MNKKLEDMIAESKLKEILHKNEAGISSGW